MSDRDVIAETISAHTTMIVAPSWPPTMRCRCGWKIQTEGGARAAAHAEHLADQIGDALRESRTVRTVEELDALPHLSLVRELGKYGAVWERRDETVCSHRWEQIAGDALSRYPRIPARVLYVPGDENAL